MPVWGELGNATGLGGCDEICPGPIVFPIGSGRIADLLVGRLGGRLVGRRLGGGTYSAGYGIRDEITRAHRCLRLVLEMVQDGRTHPSRRAQLALAAGHDVGAAEQEFRYDVWRQPGTPGDTDYNFGGGKGLEFIAAPHVQLMVGAPPYIAHEGGKTPDGYGDIPVMMKVGLAAAGPGEGDYLVTLLLSATVPGGSASIRDAVISPGIALGKGWRNFDVQTTLGGNLPTGDVAAIGRQLVSNTAFQYRALWRLWPEVEVNSTSFVEGKNAGQTQVFLTPGLGFGRVRLWRALKFSTAAGVQIAATRFHTYNHRAMFSVRYSF